MSKWIMALAISWAILPGKVFAQSNDSLVGTWKLVTVIQTDEKGATKHAFGLRPKGFVTYTADGRMSVIITAEGRSR